MSVYIEFFQSESALEVLCFYFCRGENKDMITKTKFVASPDVFAKEMKQGAKKISQTSQN